MWLGIVIMDGDSSSSFWLPKGRYFREDVVDIELACQLRPFGENSD
jgi:hypothetical protein